MVLVPPKKKTGWPLIGNEVRKLRWVNSFIGIHSACFWPKTWPRVLDIFGLVSDALRILLQNCKACFVRNQYWL